MTNYSIIDFAKFVRFCDRFLFISAKMKRLLLSLLAVLFMFVICGESYAFKVQKVGNRYEHWEQDDFPIHYNNNPSGFATVGINVSDGTTAIHNSFSTWQSVSTSTVTCQSDDESSTVATVAEDGVNVIFWVTDNVDWSHGPNASAHTTTHIDGSTGQITEWDIELNGTPAFTATRPWSATGESGKLDFQSVVTHEVGHVFGLDHVDNAAATMYGFSTLGDIGRRTLHQDDINGVTFLYPATPVAAEIDSGDIQTGPPGIAFPQPFRVRISDGIGVPLPGRFVIFDIIDGTGTLERIDPVETDTAGLASILFTPDSSGKVVLRAVAAGLKELLFWGNNQAPVLAWLGSTGYENDGVNPEEGFGSTWFGFKIIYQDADGDAPAISKVWIDEDGDDLYEVDESFDMYPQGTIDYIAGVVYTFWTQIPFSAGSSNIKYYFEYRDRSDLAPAAGIPAAFSPATAINAPDVLDTSSNAAPEIDQGDGPLSVSMDEDGAPTVWMAPTLSATDANGDSLTWSVLTAAVNGTADVSGTGSSPTSFNYAPAANFSGADSFVVQVTDSLATDTIIVNVIINPINDPPVAADDAYATDEDVPLNVAAPGVLSNDTDPDGDPLTAVVNTLPGNGTLTLNSDGSFVYTPNADFNGADSFTFKANDTLLDSNIATVSITINAVNDPPMADAGLNAIVVSGALVTLDGSGSSDQEGGLLIYSWSFSSRPPDSNTTALDTSDPIHPTFVADVPGTYVVQLIVNDGLVNSAPAVVTITADSDTDGDGVPQSLDNCPAVANADQQDTNNDGYGNMCDGDLNNDDSTDTLDLQLYKGAHGTAQGEPNYDPDADFNGDGTIEIQDLNIYKGLHRKPSGT